MKDYTIYNIISKLDSLRENSNDNEEKELILLTQNLIEQNFDLNSLVKDHLKNK